MNRAFDAGKEVILSTGRCVAELREYFKRIPGLRYVVCSSGAILYDVKEEKILYSNSISTELAEKILTESKKEDLMVHLLAIESIVQKKDIPQMERFGMGVYRPMYEKVTTQVDDIYEYYKEHPFEVPKLNLYHATAEGRERTRKRLAGLDLVLADAEKTALECSATGVTKGTGLLRLCEHLGIEPEETIAVGDADNDLNILETAGLAIAVGNANEHVKAVAAVVVNDCDHDGCAEAIDKYLL